MSRRFRAGAPATVCGVFLLGCALVDLGAKSQATDGKEPPAKAVFGDRVWTLHLEIPAREYEAMQPPPADSVSLALQLLPSPQGTNATVSETSSARNSPGHSATCRPKARRTRRSVFATPATSPTSPPRRPSNVP